MKLFKLSMAILLFATSLMASDAKKDCPLGTWSFQAPDAPWGYHKGDIVIEQKGNDYTIAIVFDQYNKLDGNDVVVKGKDLSFNVYVEGEMVLLKGTIEKDKLNGTASYSEGVLPIKAIRKINVDFSGTWSFDAPDAPEGYTEGKIVIKKSKDGKYGIQIVFDEYNKADAENVMVDGSKLSFLAYVEGEAIFVRAEAGKTELKAKASYSEGTLSVIASKIK